MTKVRTPPADRAAFRSSEAENPSPLRLAWSSSPFHGVGSGLSTPFVEPEGLFAELDGCEMTAAGHTWRAEVFGIRDDEGSRWIQLLLSGPRDYMLTLRLGYGEGVSHAVQALTSWLADPSQTGKVLNVA